MKWRFLAWAIAGALIAVGAAGWALMRNGASAQSGLSQVEENLLYRLRKSAVALDAQDRANPYGGAAEAWQEAASHFREECAVCHGSAGRGDGMLGDKLFPPAPDLTQARTQQLSDGELHHIISEGIRLTGMPAMGAHESPDEIWKLVALVRKLPELDEAQMARAAESHSDAAPAHEEVGTTGSER